MQQQIRSLVGREAARKAQREGVRIKEMLCGFDLLGRPAGDHAAALVDRSRAVVRHHRAANASMRRVAMIERNRGSAGTSNGASVASFRARAS